MENKRNRSGRKVKPLFSSKFDSRFIWEKATQDEKMKHTQLVFDSNVIKNDGCWIWKGCKDQDGYGYMTFEKKHQSAHRIAWKLYKGEVPKGMCVLHNCPEGKDRPDCCNPEHLFLGTPKDNWDDMVKKGRRLFKKGSECKFAKLTEQKVRNIKKLLLKKISEYEIAKKYKVSRGSINDIRRKRNWKHVQIDSLYGNFDDLVKKGVLRGSACPWAKLNEEQVREIKKLLESGKGPTEISKIYNIDRRCISSIKHGIKWKHVK